jgi:uncharacterized protein
MASRSSRVRLTMAACAAALLAGTLAIVQAQQAQTPPCGGRSGTPRVACPEHVDAMMAALPTKAPATPKRPRKILVLAKATGYVHSSIPLAARTIEEMGNKTGAWTATTAWESDVITAENLKQYDAILLDSTTGTFLDDPKDPAVTAARKKAFLDFVRGGKGLVGIHAATDTYHGDPAAASAPPEAPPASEVNVAMWPEFNRMIGGWFKHHWTSRTTLMVKIDDPKSPINTAFKGQPFEITDETYTFPMDSWSRENVHVLKSVDYSNMSDDLKAHEPASSKRTDGDYGVSWIRRDGKGRVFYEAHGHNEAVYAIKPMLEHILAGIQYALGDLQADDSPSGKPGTKGSK